MENVLGQDFYFSNYFLGGEELSFHEKLVVG